MYTGLNNTMLYIYLKFIIRITFMQDPDQNINRIYDTQTKHDIMVNIRQVRT